MEERVTNSELNNEDKKKKNLKTLKESFQLLTEKNMFT